MIHMMDNTMRHENNVTGDTKGYVWVMTGDMAGHTIEDMVWQLTEIRWDMLSM